MRGHPGDHAGWLSHSLPAIRAISVQRSPTPTRLLPRQPKIRMDSFQSTDPGNPTAAQCGLGIAKIGPLIGHDGQIPGYMTFMGRDPSTGLTIVTGTNLATVPKGEGSALQILKGLLPIFCPNAAIPGGDPVAAPTSAGGTTTTSKVSASETVTSTG